jgi:immunoglobulin-like protein involved in spore germination/sporulation and spore germination protein
MNTPTPTDREIAEKLASVLRSEAERVTPQPALRQILTRAHEENPTKSTPRRGRGWLPVIGGVVATAGLIAAAILIFSPGEEQRTTLPPAETCAVKVHEGCPVNLAVYFAMDTGKVHSAGVTVTSSGNVGLDAVQALLSTPSHPAYNNYWHGYDTIPPDSGPIAKVNDVTHSQAVITVDFDRPLTTNLASMQSSLARTILNQLVFTAQSALRTYNPVVITIDGKPAKQAFGMPLTNPGTGTVHALSAPLTQVEGIRPESPRQHQAVTSPVTFTGQSTSFEGTLQWEITKNGEVVKKGHDKGGSNGIYGRYSITAKLAPGEYTFKLWEPNQASGAERWADQLSVIFTDFRVR